MNTVASTNTVAPMNTVALLCTRGFADLLSLGRQNRPDPYARHVGPSPWTKALPEAWRLEVSGRIDAHGKEVEVLDLSGLAAQLKQLPQTPSAVAVSLLFSSLNPAHELAVQKALAGLLPGVPVVCSHTLAGDAHWGEFEWTVAAVAKAGVPSPQPEVSVTQDLPPLPPLAYTLETLCNAMQAELVEKAVSSVVREAMDCAAAVFLPDGRMMAQARSLPLLLGSLTPAIAGILEHFAVKDMRSDDVFLSNDPWSGGTHFPDVVLLQPVILQGRVRALAACILHHQDVGGLSPGSVPTQAQSSYQEGLRIPPQHWIRQGVAEPGLTRLLLANSRRPDNLQGDLAAQRACLQSGVEQLGALIEHHGEQGERFEAEVEELWQLTEQATRAALSRAPDGRYEFSDALDGDGLTEDPVTLKVVLEKQHNHLRIDLRGCSDQTQGPVNASRGAVSASVTFFARMLAPQAPSNGACTQPIELLTRPGSVVDPLPGAAVNARTNLVKLLANALLGAWAQAAPQDQPAPNAGVAVVLSLSGECAGRSWVLTEIIASAAGGAPWGPGGSGVSTDVGNARNTPAQSIEAQAPIRVESLALRHGSGGKGLHDGGCGVVRRYRLLEGAGQISYRGERHQTQAQGAAGGAPGKSGCAYIERGDGRIEALGAKQRAHWQAGDVLVMETAGAGGWGLPTGAPSSMVSPPTT